MMSSLFDFMTDLATDPQKQLTFAQDPEAVMEVVGLMEADKIALKSGARDKISQVFARELTDGPSATCCIDPGPDPMLDPDSPPEPVSAQKD